MSIEYVDLRYAYDTLRIIGDTNVGGVGIGLSHLADTAEPGAPTLTVYLDEPSDQMVVEATPADTMNAVAVRSPRVP